MMMVMMFGVKIDVGVIGVSEEIECGDCLMVVGNELVIVFELVEIGGKVIGIIFIVWIIYVIFVVIYVKFVDCNWEDNFDMLEEVFVQGCIDIVV